jgi:GMP synthase (glutamine-hydrolysing)
MSRKVLAFRHVLSAPLGHIADSLESNQIEFEYAGPHDGGVRGLDGFAGLIVLGGPMSAADDLPYLRGELECIAEAVSAGLPVLGICLGAQLIAKALGSRVYSNGVREIGWYPIQWTEAAARDPLHQGLAGFDTVFHWHYETFDLPAGAELLASSAACRHQAFRVGSNVYGLQFHLEATPAIIACWLEQDERCGETREADHPIDPGVNASRLEQLGARIFGRWCGLLGDGRPC